MAATGSAGAVLSACCGAEVKRFSLNGTAWMECAECGAVL